MLMESINTLQKNNFNESAEFNLCADMLKVFTLDKIKELITAKSKLKVEDKFFEFELK
jgi:hypothetical protein